MDWNVITTVYDQRGLRHARRFLSRYGEVSRTDFHNVLVLQVPDIEAFLAAMAVALEDNASIFNDISRIMPAHVTFSFESVAEFEDEARAIARQWADQLAGKSFHVRLHRRTGGSSVKLRSHTEEVLLDNAILQHLSETGRPGRVKFEDPDYVLDIETVGPRAGMSIWSRDDLRRFPFLHVD
jgi:tRNA(Ser,Leu) C12 N-acetylase TAN1